VVVLSTAATGAVFLNSVYAWPKMLAGHSHWRPSRSW
jgi:hypothetical protein